MSKVDFFRWNDMYHVQKREANKLGQKQIPDMRTIYDNLINFFIKRKDSVSIMTCRAEFNWFQCGKPYYKIWPNMAHALGNVSIDIDGSYLHLPFPTYEICLPKDDAIREKEGSPRLRSLLVHRWENEDAEFPLQKRNYADRDYTLLVHYQFDTDIESDGMGWYYSLPVKKGITLNDFFEETWERDSFKLCDEYKNDYIPSKYFAKQIVALAISTAFFGTHNHQVVMPDIPEKFIERYHKAVKTKNDSEAKQLLDKAKRLGHFGWKVGSEIDLPLPHVRHINENTGGNVPHNSLQFGHIRSGHMRLQPYGSEEKKNKHYELIFIPPTAVRPDLPIRQMHGYRIKDELLQGKS